MFRSTTSCVDGPLRPWSGVREGAGDAMLDPRLVLHARFGAFMWSSGGGSWLGPGCRNQLRGFLDAVRLALLQWGHGLRSPAKRRFVDGPIAVCAGVLTAVRLPRPLLRGRLRSRWSAAAQQLPWRPRQERGLSLWSSRPRRPGASACALPLHPARRQAACCVLMRADVAVSKRVCAIGAAVPAACREHPRGARRVGEEPPSGRLDKKNAMRYPPTCTRASPR